MILSKGQQALFWKAFAGAWRHYCEVSGEDPANAAARDTFRHRIVSEAVGVASLRDVRRGAAFDALLKQVYIEAGDYARAGHMEAAEAQRIRARCEDCLRQICEVDGREAGAGAGERWAYVSRVAGKAFGGRCWEDIPERDLEKVFFMLDTHRRRLLRRAGWRGGKGNAAEPLGFQMGRRYARVGGRVELAGGMQA